MELTYSLVQLLVALSVVHASARLKETEDGGVTETISEEQRKIHQECRNPDYKKYVTCLMRPKRHHHHADTLDNDPVHCLEECIKKCSVDMHDCDKKCSHCTKKYKHRHQIVTEYEVNCESGNCNGSDDLRATNITTNIDINNIINTHPINGTGPGTGPGTGVGPGTGIGTGTGTGTGTGISTGPGTGPGNGIGPGPGPGPGTDIGIGVGVNGTVTDIAVPSIPLVPQISMVPQITYGINLAGGCMFSSWLCIQQGATRKVQPDCSVCGNPLLHHRCNVTFCYAASSVGTACKSPACVGGST